ncbi:MAG: amino acid adenylation domain-containing protein, partial [Patescibacteria group bacterium]|nr:amino acid adenylation domain-containing protein [Patescibacteria group bacterium]
YLTDIKNLSVSNPKIVIDDKQLAYVIYTSGSTGKPKGVMIEHGSLFNRLEWMQNEYTLDSSDKILFKTPYSFDVSVWEIFWWAMYGSRLVILEDGFEGDPQKILEVIKEKEISVLHFVPSMLNIFISHIDANRINPSDFPLKKVFTSGEALGVDSVLRFKKLFNANGTEIHNLYGPTEAAIDVTYYDCRDISVSSKFVLIGKAIANNRVFIADKNLNEVCKGCEGEIMIQGVNLARGYLNNIKKTSENFVFDSDGIRTYKTGDFGVEMLDGNIKYLGRKDNQVKIRGNRIELDEIRKVILDNSNISDCRVIDSDELNEEKKIICFYVFNETVQEENLIRILERYLPTYSIPNVFIKIKNIPTTIHGKLDRNKLLGMVKSDLNISEKIDFTETQKIIVEIFENNLKTRVSGDSDFFRVGGNSLLAMVVINEINSTFKTKLPISVFFKNPTPLKLARIIDAQEKGLHGTDSNSNILTGLYPASHNQTRSFFLNNLDIFRFYNVIQVCDFPINTDIDRLEKAIDLVLAKHNIFKTLLIENKGAVYQKIDTSLKIKITRINLTKKALEQFIEKERKVRFDLSNDLPIRVFLIKRRNKKLLLMNIHHSACDARSLEILNTQISERYLDPKSSISMGSDSYIDFTLVERDMVANKMDKAEIFWKNYLNEYKDTKLPLDLNFKRDRILNKSTRATLNIASNLTKIILKFCNDNGITEFNFFIAVFVVFLSKISSESEIIIGTPIANRIEEGFWETVGYFANTIPLRFKVQNTLDFKELCSNFRENYLECMDNAFVPFDKVIERIEVKRTHNTNPVFQTLFSFKGNSILNENFILSKSKVLSDEIGDMSLIFDVVKRKKDYEIILRFNPELFLQDTIERFLKNFEVLVKNILSDGLVDSEIGKIQLLDEKQTKEIIRLSRGKKVSFDKDKKLFEYIFDGLRLNRDNIAVIDHSNRITYKDLVSRILTYASFLRESGVKDGDFIPVIMERNIDSLVAIYSVMYCGAAYIPIVPEYPTERIKYIIDDSKASLVVNSSNSYKLENEIKDSLPHLRVVHYFHDVSNSQPSISNTDVKTNNDIACVFYTSGSTGTPKGVLCTHSGYINIVDYIARKYSLTMKTIAGHTSNFTFDISLGIMNAVFSKGGTLVLFSPDELKNPERIRESLIKNKIDFAHFVPTILNYLNLEDTYLTTLASGAEKISPNLAMTLSSKFKFFFEYGPTESSIFTTVWEGNDKDVDTVPIGKPVDNTRICILDENMNFVPIGTPGNIYIAGVGLSKGYLKNPDKTREAFVQDKLESDELMYKTGDIGRFIHTGDIVFLGRKDNQVKIGGYRIESGEIENLVLKREDISACCVDIQTNDSGFSSIILYYSAKKEISAGVLNSYLKEFLPNYMIPSKTVYISRMPHKINGKIDVDKLRQIKGAVETISQDLTSEQNIIKNVWCKTLNIDTLDLYSDFFELGGSSLKILEIIYYLKRDCNITVSVSDFYKNTIFKYFCDLAFSQKSHANEAQNLIEKTTKESVKKRDPSTKNRKVLLTGSTGFLGAHILKELIKPDCFNEIYLLIRGSNISEAYKKLHDGFGFYYPQVDISKIKVILGDVSLADLGVSEKDKHLIKNIDIVVNCAAKVQHLGKKEEFEAVNVNAVKNIIKTIGNKNLEFYQASTLSIFGKLPANKNVVYENELGVGQSFENFYDETKFHAEVYLEDFFKTGGRGGVFRLGNIMNNSKTGVMQRNIKENAFTMMLQSIINTKNLWGLGEYRTNISPVDKCAEFIVESICNYDLQGNTVNVYSPHLISMRELVKLANQVGVCEINETKNNQNIPNAYVPYLTNYMNTEDQSITMYDNTNYNTLAGDLKFSWPDIDTLYVSKIIEYLIKNKII